MLRVVNSISFFLIFGLIGTFASDRPLYGPRNNPYAVPLSKENSYFRNKKNIALDFWTLISYYEGQHNDYSCSVGAVLPVLNSVINWKEKKYGQINVGYQELLNKVKTGNWKERVSEKGFRGKHGVPLVALENIVGEVFRVYGQSGLKIRRVHVSNTNASTLNKIKEDLVKNEISGRNFIIANFDGSKFFDDPEPWGHIAVIGAFDEDTNRILILDPYRTWYSPYWVTLERFVLALATKDTENGNFRGYLYLEFPQS